MSSPEEEAPGEGADVPSEDSAPPPPADAVAKAPAKGAELVIEDSLAARQADAVASYAAVERPPSVMGALGGGLGAALIGATIWWLLIRTTGYELGLIAILVGVLAGLGVVKLGGRGPMMQIIGGLCAVLGIVAGKVLYYYAGFDESIAEQLVKETGMSLEQAKTAVQMSRDAGVLDLGTYIKESTTAMSVLMMAFGLFEGWRIPRATS